MTRRFVLAFAFSIALLLSASRALAQMPEERGSLSFMEWDAGSVPADTTSLRTRVLYPEGAGPYPLVGVIHGAGRTGGFHIELARTLASRGFVVVLPDMPCTPIACDHAANARQIAALMTWAVSQSGMAGSRIAGLVDATRRGLIGHSWGALASHLRASMDGELGSLVLFDPNDDGAEGLDATSAISAPTLQLLAQVPGACNSQWREDMVRARLPEPHLQMTVSRSAHCDPEEPGDFICPLGCGSGVPSTSRFFRRYAVAWTECNLLGAASAAPWLGGASMDADVDADVLRGVVSGGLETLRCASAAPGSDAGVDADAGVDTDAGERDDAGSIPREDAGTTPGTDGGSVLPGTDAATPMSADGGALGSTAGGCGCRVGAAHAPRGLLALLGLALASTRRRHRKKNHREFRE